VSTKLLPSSSKRPSQMWYVGLLCEHIWLSVGFNGLYVAVSRIRRAYMAVCWMNMAVCRI